jgi:hypothetical protein
MDAIQWATAYVPSGQARLGTAMGRYLEVFTISTVVNLTDQLVGQDNQLTTEPAPTSPGE